MVVTIPAALVRKLHEGCAVGYAQVRGAERAARERAAERGRRAAGGAAAARAAHAARLRRRAAPPHHAPRGSGHLSHFYITALLFYVMICLHIVETISNVPLIEKIIDPWNKKNSVFAYK